MSIETCKIIWGTVPMIAIIAQVKCLPEPNLFVKTLSLCELPPHF